MSIDADIQLRHVFQVTNGATPASVNSDYWDGNLLWVTPQDLSDMKNYWIEDTQRKISESGYHSSGTVMAPIHSIVLSKRAPIGQLAILKKPACSNQGCFLLTPRIESDSRFFLYWLSCQTKYLQALGRGSTFMELSTDDLKAIRVPSLALSRQRAIADYLDRETARLDTLVAAKQRMFDLLAERRQAIIAVAVTGGVDSTVQSVLPPPSAFLDDESQNEAGANRERDCAFAAGDERVTCLDWIGMLPEQWEAKPLRSVSKYIVSNVDKSASDDEIQVRLCNYTDVYHNEYITLDLNFMNATASEHEIEKFGLSTGDVILTKDSESWNDIGVPTLVQETADDLVCGYHLALLRPYKDVMDSAFLFRCIQAKPIRLQLELSAKGVTRFGLPRSEIGAMLLPVPPLPQQRAIAEYLDRETTRLDTLKAKIHRTITFLKERRAALIAAAVTGQIAVEDVP